MRFACLFLVATLGVASYSAPPVVPDVKSDSVRSLLTVEQKDDVKKVVDALFAAGLPDTRNATVYSGELKVTATFDPTTTAPPLPSHASRMQMTDPKGNAVTYMYGFKGLHFKLSDGSWVISLAYHFKPAAAGDVDATGAKEVDLATLTAAASAEHPFGAEKAAPWLDAVPEEKREMAKDAMVRFVPITMHLRIGPDSLAPAAVMLHRAGWSDAADFCLIVADRRARDYWQLRPWKANGEPFDPTGQYESMQKQAQMEIEKKMVFVSEAPDVALRRAMFRICRGQIMTPDAEERLLKLPVAAAVAKAALDPKDPQGYAAAIDALVEGAKLPYERDESASLVEKLQSWEARPRRPRMVVTGGGASIKTAFSSPAPAYVPQPADVEKLVALLADERPSRFSDFSGPRTVGDNAWRALAILLKDDPRKTAGYSSENVWTVEERRAAAKAFQEWWKVEGKEAFEKRSG